MKSDSLYRSHIIYRGFLNDDYLRFSSIGGGRIVNNICIDKNNIKVIYDGITIKDGKYVDPISIWIKVKGKSGFGYGDLYSMDMVEEIVKILNIHAQNDLSDERWRNDLKYLREKCYKYREIGAFDTMESDEYKEEY